ncbi:MAG: hypothetical protein K0S25_14 [Bacillus sp. (in: firmicutes)]|jgi:uncharacterized protein (UPF0147 family)|nr:hypothetical protein [Bacillus sp. (in: firmicutes)]
MAVGSVTVDIKMSQSLIKLLDVVREIPKDERIPINVREEFMDKVNKILEDRNE